MRRACGPLPMPSERAHKKVRSSILMTEWVSPQALSPSLVRLAMPNAASKAGFLRKK